MENSNLGGLLDATMSRLREMMDVNTVVGNPITTPDGVTLVPVSRVSLGFGVGGSDFPVKQGSGFGGGNGAGIKIDPIGFLVVKEGSVRMINLAPPAATTVDRVIDKAPDIIELLEGLVDKLKNRSEA